MTKPYSPLVRSLLARVILVNAFIYLLVGFALWESRQQYLQQAELESSNLAYSLSANVAGVLDKIDVALAAVAGETERQITRHELRPGSMREYLRGERGLVPEIEGLRLSDARGDAYEGGDQPAGPATNIVDREYFKAARAAAAGRAVLSEPIVSRQTGHWVLVLARAVHAPDGSFEGVVSGVLELEYFNRLFASIDVGTRGLIAIRNDALSLVARRSPASGTADRSNIGTRNIAAPTLAIMRSGATTANYETAAALDGIVRLMAFRHIPRWPLAVFVGLSDEDFLAPWRREVAVLVSVAMLFTLGSVFSAALSRRRQLAERRSVEELRASKEELERSETRFRTLYDSTSDAVVLNGHDGFIDCNRAAMELFGVTTKESLGARSLVTALSPPTQPCGTGSEELARQMTERALREGHLRFEWLHRRGDNGHEFPAEVVLTRMTLDSAPVLQSVIRDITERKQAEERIRDLAFFDALTRLPNRRLLLDRLEHAMVAGRRTGHLGALMMLDLDNFKNLNDTRGHDVGDRLLVEVARRLRTCVRQTDTVARLGGDEYVVIAEHLGADEVDAGNHAEQLAEKILLALRESGIDLGGAATHDCTVSIGVTLFRGEDAGIDILLKQADLALYQAKAAGRNTVRFFNPEMQSAIDARAHIQAALREGLRNGEFVLHYQPQVGRDGRTFGAEALLRWLPPGRDPVPPGDFIGLAEETGLIMPIGAWVMRSACEQLRAWSRGAHTRGWKIAVNVSPRQFRQADFPELVRECLQLSGADPSLLKLELTEGMVLENIEEVIYRMRQIKALGVTFALDDFGTGFSSLSYLKRLPLDQVKIDQSFVRDLVSDPNDAAIVRAIVAMSVSLGLEVVAEGVETAEQLAFLHECGCERYQGYYFGRPLPIAQWTAPAGAAAAPAA